MAAQWLLKDPWQHLAGVQALWTAVPPLAELGSPVFHQNAPAQCQVDLGNLAPDFAAEDELLRLSSWRRLVHSSYQNLLCGSWLLCIVH